MLTKDQILHQGRYRIINSLGPDGIGLSYEAFDNFLDTNVLIKEIPENLGKVTTTAQLEARRAICAGKAKLLTGLKHESLLHVKDFFVQVDCHYLVTEFIKGNTLGELLDKKTGPFPLADVLGWADGLLDALNYLHTHSRPIIHHEVKPQNIWLAPNGKVKLLVFNVVKSADEQINASNDDQTFDAAVLPYLPLEQIWNGLDAASKKVILTNYDEKSEKILEQPLDARSDIYAIAATIYHLLTGQIPADALTRSIEILEGNIDPLQPPGEHNRSVPHEVSDVLMKALEIKREDRFSSAVIMRQVLRTAIVRFKERESARFKPEDDAVLEIPVIETKPVAPRLPQATPNNPAIESEQLRQLNLIKQQLREADARRLQAEQRAAEAEKRLLEAGEKHITVDPLPINTEAAVEAAPAGRTGLLPDNRNEITVKDYQSDEFSSLFAEPERESNIFKKVAGAAAILIVLGGATFGIWSWMVSNSTASDQTVSSGNLAIPAPTAEATPPVAPVETVPVSNYETTSDTNTTPPVSPSLESVTTVANPAIVKTKTAASPASAPTKKPAATPVKTAEIKKKVTLDDLLKDN